MDFDEGFNTVLCDARSGNYESAMALCDGYIADIKKQEQLLKAQRKKFETVRRRAAIASGNFQQIPCMYDIFGEIDSSGKTFFHEAISYGSKETIAFLIGMGCDPLEEGKYPETPISTAIRERRLSSLHVILNFFAKGSYDLDQLIVMALTDEFKYVVLPTKEKRNLFEMSGKVECLRESQVLTKILQNEAEMGFVYSQEY